MMLQEGCNWSKDGQDDMSLLSTYVPIDRLHAMGRGERLPDRTRGAALFADISGFTPLTEALTKELGPRRGAQELTRQLNTVLSALIDEVHRHRGSVIAFSGDAITCWCDCDAGLRDGLRPGFAASHVKFCAG